MAAAVMILRREMDLRLEEQLSLISQKLETNHSLTKEN